MALLTPEEITAAVKAAEGWTLDGKAIRKQFAFQDFPEAVLFVSALVPSLAAAEMTGIRTGLRPKGPDDIPILGRSTAVPGLIYATAHYRNGVLFTPLTVQLVRDLVFDRPADPALRDLDPARAGRL